MADHTSSMIATVPSKDALLSSAQKLPASPQVLVQLALLLLDVNSALSQIAKLLKRDAALAARILRISNSPTYGGSGSIASVDEAVSRVGFGEVYRLTGLASVAQMTSKPLAIYGVSGTQVRDNTLFCAVACEAIARVAKLDSQAAYTAGLMRSCGKLVLNEFANELRERVRPFDVARGDALSTWEQGALGITSSEVATIVLESWGFPSVIIGAVRDHYQVGDSTLNEKLTLPLHLAACMAAVQGFALPGEQVYWTATPAQLSQVGLNQAAFGELGKVVLKAFESLRASVQ